MKRIIIPKKICGLKVSEHCYQRMRERNIHPRLIEEVLIKRANVVVKNGTNANCLISRQREVIFL